MHDVVLSKGRPINPGVMQKAFRKIQYKIINIFYL